MDEDKFDDTMQELTLTVHTFWAMSGGRDLTSEELQELNDKLTAFFEDKK